MDVRPLGAALASAQTKTLLRAEQVEVIRLIVPAGKEIPEHKAKGELVVQCLEGRVAFTALGKTQPLEAGQLLYLPTGEPHSVKGVENASHPPDDPPAPTLIEAGGRTEWNRTASDFAILP